MDREFTQPGWVRVPFYMALLHLTFTAISAITLLISVEEFLSWQSMILPLSLAVGTMAGMIDPYGFFVKGGENEE